MSKLMKKRSIKAGLPPGSLVFIGDKRVGEAKVHVIDYDENHIQEKTLKKIDECFVFKNKASITWIDVDMVNQTNIVEKLGECHVLHPLVLEDILNTDQRPKMEDFGEYLYIVVRMLSSNGNNGDIDSEQLSIILGPNYLISFQEKEGDVFDPIRERLRADKGRIRKAGADYLAYCLLDAIVDNYFVVLEKHGERIEFLEEQLIINPTPATLQAIHALKRDR